VKRLLPAAVLALGLCLSVSEGTAQQTKEQCRDCCSKLGLDEYYTEQCKLKCFRNPESCARSRQPTEQAGPPRDVPRRPPQEDAAEIPGLRPQRPPDPGPPQAPGQDQGPPKRERSQRQPAFTFPNPLDLTAGREWEAAAQIVGINGLGPGHPNLQAAVKSVEQLLINFARNNPSGGKLPVAELQNILKAFR
jgi:hypothetical protein